MCHSCFAISLEKRQKNIESPSKSFRGQHQLISYDELRHATNDFDKGNLIGSGSFGSVYKGHLSDGMAVAVKVIDTEITGSLKSFLAECTALKHVRHRNLLKLITSCSSIDFKNHEFLALVFEFMGNGSLDDWITGKRRTTNGEGLNILDRLNVAIDVASAISYLHNECEVPLVHCDLKPSNILMDSNMTAKVGDFGLARWLIKMNGDQPFISSTHTLKGTIGYIPPEYGTGGKPSTAGDVYSFGILLLELFTGKSPRHETFMGGLSLKNWVQMNFPTNMEEVLDQDLQILGGKIFQDNESIHTETQCDCLISIVGVGLSCVADSPDKRISMKDALQRLKNGKDALLKPNFMKKLEP